MDDNSLRVLEFDKIQARLEAEATTVMGRERARALTPATDVSAVRRWQAETGEARTVRRSRQVPLAGIRDIRRHLQRAERGAALSPEEFNEVLSTLRAGARLRRFLDGLEGCPALRAAAAEVRGFPDLEGELAAAITEANDVADQASPELARLRRQLRVLSGRIKERVDSMVRSPEVTRYLQEALVTIRSGRYVLPVKQEHRAQVPGLVHDQSASGATLFIEPMALVELGNDLRQLELAEQREVEKVLQRLSGLLAAAGPEVLASVLALGELDFIFARAALGDRQRASAPEVGDAGPLVLRAARHPLLGPDAVPVDVRLGDEFDILVITGPNTGGKTVTLKTVGLLVLMAQAGLHLPAEEGSRVGVYAEVLCDVGDEQSIEQSLSTFSSHMTNIVRFMGRLRGRCLVLLDELGAGTDPAEGSSLGTAILEHLLARGAHVVATTHYTELKRFAFATPRVENASVEFDPETLRPTFRLLTGIPGRSNALAIAARLGLDPAVVKRAAELRPAADRQLEDLLADIHDTRYRLGEDQREVGAALARVRRLEDELRGKLQELEASRTEVLARARREARDLLTRVRTEAQLLLRELRAAGAGADAGALTRRAGDTLEALRSQLGEDVTRPEPGPAPDNLRSGEPVRVVSLGLDGYVVEPPGAGGQAQVQVGIMKVTVDAGDLRRVAAPAVVQGEGLGQLLAGKAAAFRPELDVRGLVAAEALEQVDKYIDDALLAGVRRVRVIHGKGTGALRRVITEWLAAHPRVERWASAPPAEGGDGVTVVELC